MAETLERIVTDIPAPKGDPNGPTRGLLFDSWYDPYRGVVCLVRMIDGQLKRGMKIKFMSTGREYEIGDMASSRRSRSRRVAGRGRGRLHLRQHQDIVQAKIGDTITGAKENRKCCPVSKK